ncbi:Uncharacterised protein [Mycobacteroides abscessus subsp. abscessus]|nr:Uncharacterised protein [Mycobacteroides abscessus subsp. abscessus]SKU09979.1 Uncharacterised protein [Mycobacteroides abscessus subsp. abscessus]
MAFCAQAACSADSVTPVARTPRRAAYRTIDPHPQPTSSSRSPALSASLSNTSRYLFSCASSNVASASG